MAALPLPKKPESMAAFVTVIKRSALGIAKDVALLLFLIANNISFNVVDSFHFQTWMAQLGHDFPSCATLLKHLAPLYAFVLKMMEDKVRACGTFVTTFDLWTSVAVTKYLVVTYHALTDEFEMVSAPLDLVPMVCSAYGEFVATAIESRFHQHGFDNLVHAASFSDSGSNCVAAKSLLTPLDGEPCFNHNLKHAIDDVCIGSLSAAPTHRASALDFTSMHLIIAFIRSSPNLRSAFVAVQKKLSMPELELIMENLTRWEGRFKALK